MLVLGAVTVLVAFAMPAVPIYKLAVVMAGVVMLASGSRLLARANAREHGKRVEISAIREAEEVFRGTGLRLQTNVRAKGLGDIDMVVETRMGRIPVEIKSFVRWRQFLWWPGARERSALNQAGRQANYLRSHAAVVWLPKGRPTFLQSLAAPRQGGVVVVFGGAARLYNAIKKLS